MRCCCSTVRTVRLEAAAGGGAATATAVTGGREAPKEKEEEEAEEGNEDIINDWTRLESRDVKEEHSASVRNFSLCMDVTPVVTITHSGTEETSATISSSEVRSWGRRPPVKDCLATASGKVASNVRMEVKPCFAAASRCSSSTSGVPTTGGGETTSMMERRANLVETATRKEKEERRDSGEMAETNGLDGGAGWS